ncbi:MAG: hypothetical protein AAGK22_23210 [Acidobacteriota bacterium]
MPAMHTRYLSLLLASCCLAGLAADPIAAQSVATCEASDQTHCLMERFEVTVEWRDFRGNTGSARTVPGASDDSGLFYFFAPENFEMLVKVLDGCFLTNRVWVFAAATTDVEYTLRVRDVGTGETASYFNPLGRAAPAITDIEALDSCSLLPSARLASALRTPVPGNAVVTEPLQVLERSGREIPGVCSETPDALCLTRGRFRVEVEWTDFQGGSGVGSVVPLDSSDSGLFWFFDADNWEMLVKVIDGCALNQRFWVFAAATTNVEYLLRVTDTDTNTVREYRNPLGRAAPATTDTDAFATCPGGGGGASSAPVITGGRLFQRNSSTEFEIDFTDADGDMSERAGYEVRASAPGLSCSFSTLGDDTPDDRLDRGTIEVELEGGGLIIPGARVTFQVEDAAGNLSNVFVFTNLLRPFECPGSLFDF